MEEQLCRKLLDFIHIVARLREPGGCPWDQRQTPQSFKTYLIEEVYELVDAIDEDDHQEVRAELGDMLFQLIFINNLYQEKGSFNLTEVIDGISAKMIRRHPHVFGDTKVENLQELKDQWYAIKAKERKAEGQKSHQLHSLPKGLPALRRAHRVQERATKLGLAAPERDTLSAAMANNCAALREAAQGGDNAEALRNLGELLLQAAELGRLLNGSAEEALQSATNRFIAHFDRFEELLAIRGQSLTELNPEQQKWLWEQASCRGDEEEPSNKK